MNISTVIEATPQDPKYQQDPDLLYIIYARQDKNKEETHWLPLCSQYVFWLIMAENQPDILLTNSVQRYNIY